MMSEHKDIDKIFQQGSAQHDFDYNPDAWAKMEVLLDKEKRRRRFWWWFGGVFVLGGIAVGLLYNFDHSSAVNSILQQVVITNSNSKKETASSTSEQEKKMTKLSVDDKNTLERKEHESIDNQPIRASNHSSKTPNQRIYVNKNILINRTNYLHDKHEEKRVGQPLSGKKESSNFEGIHQNKAMLVEGELELLPILSPAFLERETPDIDRSLLAQKVNLQSKKSKNQWLVGVYLASEMSSVALENISRNNFRFGGQSSYRFKRKWSASIGLSYTRKKYKVNEGDYTPPKGFWTRKIAPQSTEATTDILEVPVLVEFFPKGYVNNGLFVNIGLTSYFMLKEKYRYSYDLSDPDLIRNWRTEKENNHWFGVGQFSMGYQKVISPKVYSQFGPYLQVPLTGIGHGNVKLWSFGVDWKMNFLIQ